MKTREQYLNGECTHEEYYSQFVDERVKNIVLRLFTKEALSKAYNENASFNTIPLTAWDGLAQSVKYKGPEVRETGDYLTLAGAVCIVKEAARQIVNEETE